MGAGRILQIELNVKSLSRLYTMLIKSVELFRVMLVLLLKLVLKLIKASS